MADNFEVDINEYLAKAEPSSRDDIRQAEINNMQ